MSTTVADQNSDTFRADHVRDMAASLTALDDPAGADGIINALAQAVADAVRVANARTLEIAASELRVAASRWEGREPAAEWAEERGRVYGLVDVLRWALQRSTAEAGAESVEPGSHAHRMLLLIQENDDHGVSLNSSSIATRLCVDKTQVSRTGRDLIERGLAVTRALGRKVLWEITPRGRYAIELLGSVSPQADDHSRPLALSLGDVTDERAEAAALSLAAQHPDVSAVVVSHRAAESQSEPKRRRRPAPVMLIHAPHPTPDRLEAFERQLGEELRVPVTALAVMPRADDERVLTVLPRSAEMARQAGRRARGRRATGGEAGKPSTGVTHEHELGASAP